MRESPPLSNADGLWFEGSVHNRRRGGLQQRKAAVPALGGTATVARAYEGSIHPAWIL